MLGAVIIASVSSFKTLNGTIVGKDGRDVPGALRWLGHDTSKKDTNKNDYIDFGTGKSDGCFITSIDNQKELLKLFSDWKFTNGVQLKGTINNMSYDYYKPHYPNTRGLR